MQPIVAVIAPGMMGSGVGQRLVENGIEVRTLLAGRSDATLARAKAAGMVGASDEQIVASDIILSILPPGDALGLAERLAPALRAAAKKPVYVDCNALDPATVLRIARVVQETGATFVDGGIVGGPPRAGYSPKIYLSGEAAPRVRRVDQVRPGDADPARPDRRRLGDEDVVCRHHQGLHRARCGDDAGRLACRHGRGPEGRAVRPASRRCSAG